MTENPRRLISVPNTTKGDRWRNQTVQGHVAHPPRQAQKHAAVTHSPRQVDGLHRFENWTVQDHVAHPPKQAENHVAVTHSPRQVDSLHRFKNLTVQDHVAHPQRQVDSLHRFENWSVQDHVAHPPRQAQNHVAVTHPPKQAQNHVAVTPPPRQQYQSQIIHGHISTPITTQSQILQQRKRHRNSSPQISRHQRRRIETDTPPTLAQSLINSYNKR